MAHDQVGADVRPALEGLKNSMRMPDTVFKCPAAVASLFGRAPTNAILDSLHAAVDARRQLGDERALCSRALRQGTGNMSKLRRVILMNENDVHHSVSWPFVVLMIMSNTGAVC
jgi:hypothetical protein